MEKYNKEFKEQALKLSDEIGAKKASEQLGINYGTIADWRKKRNRKNKPIVADYSEPLNEREKQLFKENQELKEANRILQDTLCFFVKGRRK